MTGTIALSLILAAADSLMGPGVSLQLARYRAERIHDVHYELAIDVTGRDTAVGTVRVSFTRGRDGDAILDFRGHSLSDFVVNGNGVSRPDFNGAHLRIPEQLLRDGWNTATMRFKSPIAAAGASVIRFTDETDGSDYLYTLLVPADANLLFPCFDQPDIKAVFDVRITVPQGWSALSNGAPAGEERGVDRSTFRFDPTKPISTYLFAFAAGPYRVLGPDEGDQLWVRRSRAGEVEADTLITLNQRARAWLADYFGIPYPFDKFGFLLAPAFPFGGMEHPGAIFYNEESFIFREPPTLVQRLGRQATIFHEVAHQWFGDFTTMRWFDDLWMKEGFATYMAARMQAAMGDATAWMTFYLRNKPPAYDVDITAGTTPVWQQLANLDQAKSNYGPIVYNKAPSVLKQLNHLVGETAFRSGVSEFLRNHAYGNATWRDLLASIGRTGRRDLTAWGNAYFLRAGMPIVEQRLTLAADGRISRLALVQRPAQALSGTGAWPMRVDVLLRVAGRDTIIPVEMTSETTEVVEARGLPAPDFVYANANDFGYGVFLLDVRSRDWLLRTNVNVRDPFLRAMLWGSLWDLVRDARLDPRRYAAAAYGALPDEQDEQIVARLLNRLVTIRERYLAPADSALAGQIDAAVLSCARERERPYGIRKSCLDASIAMASSAAMLRQLDSWLDSARVAFEPLRQPTRWSIVTRLAAHDWPSAEVRLASEARRDTTTGGRRRAFMAGAAFPRAGVKRAYFDRYFADSTLNEDWVTASLGAFNEVGQSALTLPYLRPALDTLRWVQQNRRIFFLGRWLDAFVGGHVSPEALGVVDAFLRDTPDLPRDLRLKVLQVRDDLERTARIRAAFANAP